MEFTVIGIPMDEWGNAIGTEYFDNGMQPAYNNDGYAKLECVYNGDGRVAEAYVLGTDGEPVCEKIQGVPVCCVNGMRMEMKSAIPIWTPGISRR